MLDHHYARGWLGLLNLTESQIAAGLPFAAPHLATLTEVHRRLGDLIAYLASSDEHGTLPTPGAPAGGKPARVFVFPLRPAREAGTGDNKKE